ncbi:hypothetical protein VZT92_017727 [Zoarces viviparus]|uniref:Uncharacterized protein n=1 Tax=Zoarces viviparus TaxID=48416 RepID=A0AAW1EN81_ZOAVI
MVYLDNQGYQENLVLLESQGLQGLLGSLEGKENRVLLVYQGVQACQVMVNQGIQDLRVIRGMLVFLEHQA